METRREFHPEPLSRRGEGTFWLLAALSLAALVVLRLRSAGVSPWYLLFVVLLLLTAASTSLGNWMDRKTSLVLKSQGLEFRNGLREVTLNWDEIQEVQVLPSRWGKQAHILGTQGHFSFRTKSELIHKGEIRAKMGFTQGDFIIAQILKHSGLQETGPAGDGHYYARP